MKAAAAQTTPGTAVRAHLLGWGRTSGKCRHRGDPRHCPSGLRRGKVRCRDGQHNGHDDDDPRQLKRSDNVMGARHQDGPIGQPRGEADNEADYRANESDEETVRTNHQLDVLVGGAQRAEHPNGAQTTLGENGESRNGDESD